MQVGLHRILFSLLILLTIFPCYAENREPVVIELIKTDIIGKTKRNALLRELRLHEGMTFTSEEEMRYILSVRFQEIEEKDFFQEFEAKIIERSPGRFEAVIRAEDTSSFLPIPFVAYSSDLGIIVGGTFSYQNAFGSMTNQLLLGTWSPKKTYILAEVGNITAGPMTLEVRFEQTIGLIRFGDPAGDILFKYNCMSSAASVLMKIPFGIGSSWFYWLKPKATMFYNCELEYNLSSTLNNDQFLNRGFSPGIDHGLVCDNISREENFRRGILLGFINSNSWYMKNSQSDVFVESDLIGLLPITDWLEISGRIGGFYAITGTRQDAGDRLRGTLDYMAYGTAGAYFTGQINFRTIRTSGGFELQIRPFTDIGYIKSEEWEAGKESFEYCVGGTFIFFFPSIPSLSLNFDFGWDLKRNRPEIIVGIKPFI